jgi:hypothetical protein
MDKKTRALIEDLTRSLENASSRLLECACTCVDRSQGHQSDCRALVQTQGHDALTERAWKVLQEMKPPISVVFPMEYKGWRIEIKMGHQFKGARGSVRNKRGYIATRISDGKVVQFAPSYDTTPSVQTVKILIDVEERSTALYKK